MFDPASFDSPKRESFCSAWIGNMAPYYPYFGSGRVLPVLTTTRLISIESQPKKIVVVVMVVFSVVVVVVVPVVDTKNIPLKFG